MLPARELLSDIATLVLAHRLGRSVASERSTKYPLIREILDDKPSRLTS